MSDLQVALIVLGVLIIAAVVVYNWMQEKKLRKQVSGEFIVPQKDVLADDFYIDADAYVEKELSSVNNKMKDAQAIVAANAKQKAADSVEHLTALNHQADDTRNLTSMADTYNDTVADSGESVTNMQALHQIDVGAFSSANAQHKNAAEPLVTASMHEKLKNLQANLPEFTHQQIDLIAILYATKNIAANDLEVLKANIFSIGLPMMLHGLDDEDKWHLVNERIPKLSFKQVACSLQLADRGGPVAKNLLNKFQFAVEDAGLNLNAHVEWQGGGDALQRAIELDQFCIEVDQLINVHLAQTDTPIHGTKFKGLAEANGLILMADGKFYYPNHGKEEPLFVLIDTNNQPFTADNLRTNVLKSVTFQLEIPKATNCELVFNQLMGVAQKMANSLNARLVDDNQKPLGDIQIEKIRQQLRVIHATMVARGIMPGSPASMRLFN